MAFRARPFADAVAALRNSNPDAELNTGEGEHYDAEVAYSFGPIGEWSDDPPIPTLYKMRSPFSYSEKVLSDPKTLVSYANFGGAVATWNANGEGRWLASPGEWILVDVELVQEQAEQDPDYFEDSPGSWVYVIFALWKCEDGFAAAVWSPNDTDTLAKIMGLGAWPTEGWQQTTVWYGE